MSDRTARDPRLNSYEKIKGYLLALHLVLKINLSVYVGSPELAEALNSTTSISALPNKISNLRAQPLIQVFDDRTVVVPLSCSWEGGEASSSLSPATYRWSLNGNAINTSKLPGHYAFRYSGASFTIIGPGLDDVGTYRCQALTKNGHVIANSTAASVFRDVPIAGHSTILLTKGTRGRLTCPRDSIEYVTVVWLRNGKQLLNGTKYHHRNGRVLEILDVDWYDMDEYVCKVITPNRPIDLKIYVSVQGPPVAPSALRAQTKGYTPCNVVLTWSAPAFNGHRPVLGYELACGDRESGTTRLLFSTATTKTTAAVPLGHPGVDEYKCAVRANNSLGYSSWSDHYFRCQPDNVSESSQSTAAVPETTSVESHRSSTVSQFEENEPSLPTTNLDLKESLPPDDFLSNSIRNALPSSSIRQPTVHSSPPDKDYDVSSQFQLKVIVSTTVAVTIILIIGVALLTHVTVRHYKKKSTRSKVFELEQKCERTSKQVHEMEKGMKQNLTYQQKQTTEIADLLVKKGSLLPDQT